MAFLDPVLGWVLIFHPFVSILILSLLITLIINLIYKYTTDQVLMKSLKTQIDNFRKEMKEAQKKQDTKKLMKLNEDAMKVNLQYMGKSLKPTLYTFIPIIFIFAWMNAHFTYAPLDAGEPLIVHAHFLDGFSGKAMLVSETLTTASLASDVQLVDKTMLASFAVTGDPGKHDFLVSYEQFNYSGSLWFGERPDEQAFPGKGPVSSISVEYPRIHPLGPVSIFGWMPGWLTVYIILSIGLSISMRKLMKIY